MAIPSAITPMLTVFDGEGEPSISPYFAGICLSSAPNMICKPCTAELRNYKERGKR